jgi:hypothetical protein
MTQTVDRGSTGFRINSGHLLRSKTTPRKIDAPRNRAERRRAAKYQRTVKAVKNGEGND